MCSRGHYDIQPYDYTGSFPKWKCEVCGEEAAWDNLVDDTNCDNYGYVELEISVPEHIGPDGEVVETTYKIPEEKGRG